MTAPHPPTRRRLRSRAATLVASVAIAGVVVTGCGGGGGGSGAGSGDGSGESAGGPSTTIDISNLGKPTTTTTEVERSTTTTPLSRDPGANGCRAAQTLFLEPAGDPIRKPAALTTEQRKELSGQVMMRLEAMERVQFRALLAFQDAQSTNPSAAPPAGLDPVAVVEHFIRWTNDNCPPDQPAWACLNRSTATPVASAVNADPGSSGTYATPEAVLASLFDGGAGAVALGQNDAAAWFGWTDSAGLVTRVLQVVKTGEAWGFGPDSTCTSGSGGSGGGGSTAVNGSGEPGSPISTPPTTAPPPPPTTVAPAPAPAPAPTAPPTTAAPTTAPPTTSGPIDMGG